MDYMPVSEAEGEKALSELARFWDEDCISAVRGNLGEEEDVEMDQLEDYVVDALKEDEGGERARRKDGIASMTSIPPSRRSSQVGEGGDSGCTT